jgi:hypothetical protein
VQQKEKRCLVKREKECGKKRKGVWLKEKRSVDKREKECGKKRKGVW